MRLADDNCSLEECVVGGRTLVPYYSATHFYKFVVTLVGTMRTKTKDKVLLCGVDHEGCSSSFDLHGYPLNVVWEPCQHFQNEVAKLHDRAGMQHIVELRRTLIKELCRVLFLNRPNVLWIEDGCLLGKAEYWDIEKTDEGSVVKFAAPKTCPDGVEEDELVYYSAESQHRGDLTALLQSISKGSEDSISTIMWPDYLTTPGKEHMCAFKKIQNCAMHRDKPPFYQTACTLYFDQ